MRLIDADKLDMSVKVDGDRTLSPISQLIAQTIIENAQTIESDEDCISRKSLKHKLQEHHDFFVNAYGGFSNLTPRDKSRVDEITNCIAMVVNESPATPKSKTEWIPVSESLPETAFGCLVTVEEDDRNGEPQSVLYPDFVGYDGETWNDADGVPIPFEVIAWMPLPKPFEPQESEDKK